MYCTKCGTEMKGTDRFCSKCGNTINNNQSVEIKNKAIDLKHGIIGVVVLVGVFFLIWMICGLASEKNGLTEKDVENAMEANGENYIELAGEYVYLDILDVNIQEKEKKGEISYVTCKVLMANDDISAEVIYNQNYKKVGEMWYLQDCYVGNVENIKPRQGVKDTQYIHTDYVRNMYSNVEWISSDNMQIGLGYNLLDRKTDLEKGTDSFTYEYLFATNSANNTGKIKYEYIFENGVWIGDNITVLEKDIEWNLLGMWKFDIYTYYVEVNIIEIDWANNLAFMEYRGSVWEGGGEWYSGWIPFATSSDEVMFATFTIPGEGWGSSDHDITLTARLNDMYYQVPSMFMGGNPVDMPIRDGRQ